MTFQFSDFQSVATDLADTGGEAHLRSAVGRLYYALFHVALSRTGAKSRKSIHKAVVVAVRAHDRALGDQLDKLRRLRVEADYNLAPRGKGTSPDWQRNWNAAHTIASRILPRLWKI